MRFVILHYHLFKNAGSTLEDILDHSFGDRFATLETPVDGGLITGDAVVRFLDARPALQAFSSHQIRYPMPAVPGYLFFDICFLRDPLDRLRSFYDYFRQRPNPASPISELANGCLPGDFVAGMIHDHSLFVRNNQVNLLACGGDSDEPDERDLELAIQRMRACSFPGVVDRFEQSMTAGAQWLLCAFPELNCARPPVNVSRGMQGTVADRIEELRQACDPAVFEELLRITELDRRLVEETRVEVARRLALLNAREIRGREVPGAQASNWRPMSWQMRGLFDRKFYLRKYSDVAAAGIDPLRHYRQHGAAEGRKPHPLFDPGYYGNSLEHFLGAGISAANPHPLFDCRAYLEAHPEVTGNPLVHYLKLARVVSGGAEIRDVRTTEEPQQQPFLRAVNPEQIRAQLSSR